MSSSFGRNHPGYLVTNAKNNLSERSVGVCSSLGSSHVTGAMFRAALWLRGRACKPRESPALPAPRHPGSRQAGGMLLEICTEMLLVACFTRLCCFINSLHSAQRLLELVLWEDLWFFFFFHVLPLLHYGLSFSGYRKYICTGGKRSRKTGKSEGLAEMQAMTEVFQDCFQDVDIRVPQALMFPVFFLRVKHWHSWKSRSVPSDWPCSQEVFAPRVPLRRSSRIKIRRKDKAQGLLMPPSDESV